MIDPRSGLGGYVQDAVAGGMQIGRAKTLAAAGTVRWFAILVGEPGATQRPLVIANRQVVDLWRQALAPLNASVGIWVVHGTNPTVDAQHYMPWKHVDLAVPNCEREYVEDPARSGQFLTAVGPHPPLVLSTNGNPAQKPMDYRLWEQAKAWLATQAYWQFNVVSDLTPKAAHQLAFLPEQVGIGPSSTSWWYRIWIRGKGNRWTQCRKILGARGKLYIELKDPKTASTWHAEVRQSLPPAGDGGVYLQPGRVLLANGTKDVGKVLGFMPRDRITPHISNENGDTGRPSLADLTAKVRACPTRKVGMGVFTLDNASDDELRTIRAAMAS